jgi:hypothetical protein
VTLGRTLLPLRWVMEGTRWSYIIDERYSRCLDSLKLLRQSSLGKAMRTRCSSRADWSFDKQCP